MFIAKHYDGHHPNETDGAFLNTDLTEKEKTKFIEDQIEISFTRFSASPVDWLEGVLAILLLIQ